MAIRGLIPLCIALSVGLSAVVAESGSADASSETVRLVFVRGGNLYTSTLNGNAIHQVTKGGGYSMPHWSPNGKQIAFQKAGGIWTMDVSGAHQVRQFTGHAPAWSPDGGALAFETPISGCTRAGVVIGSLTTHAVTKVICADYYYPDPTARLGDTVAWSPDGKRLMYNVAIPSPPDCLWCLDEIDLNEVTVVGHQLTSINMQSAKFTCEATVSTRLEADYSPTSDNVVFSSYIPDCLDTALWIFNRSDTYRKKITHETGFFPRYSADGKSVFYTVGSGTQSKVRRVTLGHGFHSPATVLTNAGQADPR